MMIPHTPARSTCPGPTIRSMASPHSSGMYSWAATLPAATSRLAATNRR